MKEHIFDGERCDECGVNIYDSMIYGPEWCSRDTDLTYTSQSEDYGSAVSVVSDLDARMSL